MNAVQKALADIKMAVPSEILHLAFKEEHGILNTAISIDEAILVKLLRPRVLMDCNIVGGITTYIDIERTSIQHLDYTNFIIDVPKSLTSGKSIVSALDIVVNFVSSSDVSSGSTGMLSEAGKMADNLGTVTLIQTSRLDLVGENKIYVSDPSTPIVPGGRLKVVLENNVNLTNINPRSYLAFSKLAILAVKMYIYNHLYIKLDQGYIYSGHEMSSIKDTVDSYSDKAEEYEEYLNTTWRKVSYFNDTLAYGSYVKGMLGNTM